MRLTGVVRTWHQDRGFGFIAPTHGGRELFVHISAFQGRSDAIGEGERVSYELGEGKDGKPQAVRVEREALKSSRRSTGPHREASPRSGRVLQGAVLVAVLLGLGAYGYRTFGPQTRVETQALEASTSTPLPASPSQSSNTVAPVPQPAAYPPAPRAVPSPAYQCDGRTHCSQMRSCEEATYFLKNCPGVQMDGNHDGVPCEQQWCGR